MPPIMMMTMMIAAMSSIVPVLLVGVDVVVVDCDVTPFPEVVVVGVVPVEVVVVPEPPFAEVVVVVVVDEPPPPLTG